MKLTSTMRLAFSLVLIVASVVLASTSPPRRGPLVAQAQQKPQDVYKLATESKLGIVTFSHINHTTKNYTMDSSGPMACIECHHTAQPAAEAAKHPPLKTVWPADRTTTLTAELIAKSPDAAGVAICRDCHSRTGEKPKLIPDVPEVKFEGGTNLITLNNQQAFHRNCAGCHDEVAKTRTDVNPPTSKKCIACHKKPAA
ncbi:MAG TPA: cytochrome c3 family protein [Pyrinomonadaceae bacterium]